MEDQVAAVREAIEKTANHAILEVFPSRIVELDTLLKENQLFRKLDQNMIQPSTLPSEGAIISETKKRKAESELPGVFETEIVSNANIVKLGSIVKKHAKSSIEEANSVKLWIQLLVPRIEDGNNFGVSVQEEVINELNRTEDSCFAMLEQVTKYFATRAKLCSKVMKHPRLEDYRRCIIEIDENEILNMKIRVLDLRNSYAILHDMLTKNLDKIKNPRGESKSHMEAMF